MSNYKLTYFDMDGGRGEPIRIAFHAAGIEFEDNRLSFPEFGAMRQDTRFNSVPVLEIDGAQVTQSNAITRYVGKMAGLYPSDDLQALYCDEVLDALEDVLHYIVPTLGMQGEELRLAREKLVDGWLSVYVRGLGELLTRGGGKYFADNKLTVADLKAFVQTRWLRSGGVDHVPTNLVERLAPGLVAHQERVEQDPRVVAYYKTRS
ncbi:MAG: glutathione S-transferase family protein [Gammaproteobacteria bacterium]|nr:glutathione S-transferase family protein [Gammaproteobacteria bacterium]MBU2676024.1 glutathione S-transferase family protein [Gammaproteobacteria bacterium]NNC56913.1 glutathione S-transferase [Woeseiaceae bacterium]NNL49760.1 glutathione S-transferase [Woeseiaceae bacterium]